MNYDLKCYSYSWRRIMNVSPFRPKDLISKNASKVGIMIKNKMF